MAGAGNDDLLGFVASMAGEGTLRVEENLGEGFVRLRVAEAERRQAKHDIRCVEDSVIELLRNSRDAGARRIFLACSREGEARTLVCLDDGSGVPEDMRERIFDARVTSKLDSAHVDRWGMHGRGMALYSIRENAKLARVEDSGTGKGTSIRVVFDVSELPERADQSSWPAVGTNDDGERSVVRGPHNIIRTCCEFALEERGRLELYVGSPAEVVATVRRRVTPEVPESKLLFIKDLSVLPLEDRLALAADAEELRDVAAGLGLEMSERTAHRIMAGQIAPLRSVAQVLSHRSGERDARQVDLAADRRGLRISREDSEAFSRIMERDFRYIADRYYLTLAQEPKVRVSRDKVTVTFEVEKGD
jgi:hypothetical protein